MATCNKCGNTYYSKECPYCKKKEWETKINKNNHIKYNKQNEFIKEEIYKKPLIKNINIPLTMIAISISIIAVILLSREYEKYQAEQQLLKMFYGTTNKNKIEEINKKLENQNEKMMKEIRKLYIPK